jgi:ferredoxin
MNYRLKILPQNKTIKVREDEILADKIQEAGINLSVYCNKRGIC